jgi:predicted nuclease with TOPRIM domain
MSSSSRGEAVRSATKHEGDVMRERIEKRLGELESQLSVGARRLHELEREEAELREALVRIGGGVIALRELLQCDDVADGDGNGTAGIKGLAKSREREVTANASG